MTLRAHRARKFDARGNSVVRILATRVRARQLAPFQCQLKLKINRERRIALTSAADQVRRNRGYFEFSEMRSRRCDAAG